MSYVNLQITSNTCQQYGQILQLTALSQGTIKGHVIQKYSYWIFQISNQIAVLKFDQESLRKKRGIEGKLLALSSFDHLKRALKLFIPA